MPKCQINFILFITGVSSAGKSTLFDKLQNTKEFADISPEETSNKTTNLYEKIEN
jgi:adenylylsulfate kinase-like enzyme